MARVYTSRRHPKGKEQAKKYGINDDEYELLNEAERNLTRKGIAKSESGEKYFANYSFNDSTTGCSGVALGSIRYKEMQDRMLDGTLEDFEELNELQRQAVIKQSNDKLANECKDFSGQGSTMASVVITRDKIYSSWLGDSRAYLVIKDADGKVKRLEPLTPNLHNPMDPKEKVRLREFSKAFSGGRQNVFDQRLAGRLAVSRALGDKTFNQFGLSRDAEMHTLDIPKLNPGETAECLLMSDSLDEAFAQAVYFRDILLNYTTDKDTFEEFLIDCLNEEAGKSTEEGLVSLARNAFRYDSTDDTTIMSIKIETNPSDRNQVKFGAVYDGHGGPDVAELARQRALPIMREESKIEANKNPKKDFSTRIRDLTRKALRRSQEAVDLPKTDEDVPTPKK